MKKSMLSTNDIKNAAAYFMLIAFAAMIIFFTYKNGFLYGSKTDWISQHTVLADYFREKFYETGHLFPDFAMNIGGGQNIYNLSYYGLLNPIILISYLLPSVTMITYISVSSITIVIISGCLCYRWLRANEFSRKISFTATICFICAGPLIFQSHRQIMFVEYLPFVFLGLIGVDQYYRTHKKGLFILSVFFCIMTSYFFSVGGILTLFVYIVFVKLKIKTDCSLSELMRDVIPFIKGTIIAILMAAVLWLPTLYVVVNGRGSGVPVSWLLLIIPTLPFKSLMYDYYSLGLTAIALVALVATLFSKKRNEKVIAFILMSLLMFPIFLYLLNGTIYVREKALIPFLPLYILVIAIFLSKVEKDVCFSKTLKLFWKRAIVLGLFLPIIFSASINCLWVNAEDELVTTEEYIEYYSQDKLALIQETLKDDSSFFRMNVIANPVITSNYVYDPRYYQTSIYSSTYNKEYNSFFYDVMHNPIPRRNRVISVSSKNILFQNFMNVKYVIAKGNAPAGYKIIDQKEEYILYKNKNTMSLGFATNRVMSQRDFNHIAFPWNMGTVFENIVISKDKKSKVEVVNQSIFDFTQVNIKNDISLIENQKNVVIRKEGKHFFIKANENASIEIPLKINMRDDILIVRFTVSDRKNGEDVDTSITINGLTNKLSSPLATYPNGNTNFVYVLSSNKKSARLTVNFSAGQYEVFDIEAYTLPSVVVGDAIEKMDPFIVDTKRTADNQITGDIQVKENGYFATTIPFDKGFNITVDGGKQSYEKVNTAFVGFPIEKGAHHIVIKYTSPYKSAGIVLSIIGLVLFAFSCINNRKYRISNKEKINGSEVEQ